MQESQPASCSTSPHANAAFRSAAAPATIAGTSRPRMRWQGCTRDSRRDAGATNCRAFGKNALLVYASPPPSTTSAAPVIQLAIGLTRNKTAFATSSGVPIRRSGRFAAPRINACTSSPS